MISGLILAAGEGKRVGQNKALLKWQGQTLLNRAVQILQATEMLHEIFVVTGANGDAVGRSARTMGANVVFNPRFEEGLMGSLQAGIGAVGSNTQAVLVMLVDLPLIKPSTVRTILMSPGSLVRPTYLGAQGHPTMISREFFDEILSQEISDQGANFLFHKYGHLAKTVEINDPGILKDFDVASDFEESHGFSLS